MKTKLITPMTFDFNIFDYFKKSVLFYLTLFKHEFILPQITQITTNFKSLFFFKFVSFNLIHFLNLC